MFLKLKSPWKGPYIITERKSPVLYNMKDRKKEEVVHHDRIKLYQNKNHPLWLSRLRNNVLTLLPIKVLKEGFIENYLFYI